MSLSHSTQLRIPEDLNRQYHRGGNLKCRLFITSHNRIRNITDSLCFFLQKYEMNGRFNVFRRYFHRSYCVSRVGRESFTFLLSHQISAPFFSGVPVAQNLEESEK
jgi:hypothetical protein